MVSMDMNVEKIKPDRKSLAELMVEMAQGHVRIPRFQRTFVWNRSKILELLDSMYKEYPIGTVFLWEAPPKYNHMLRTVEYLGQPEIDGGKNYSLILDGQQRLTSLYAVVNGLEIDGEQYGKIVCDLAYSGEDESKVFRYRTPDNRRWVAVQDVIKNDFEIYDQLPDSSFRKQFSRCYKLLSGYPFSVVIVKEVDINEAVEIFERINRAGKQLTRYDLITATVLTDDFDLRERTQKDIIRPLREKFGRISETSIPQSLALNIKNNTEHTTQLNLQASDIQEVWNLTVDCFMRAIEFAWQNLGVQRADFLPYDAMLPVLASYFFYSDSRAVISHVHKERLERWFWRVAFSERYSGASQTRMTEDATWMREELLQHNKPYDISVTTTIDTLMQGSMRSTSAVRNAILCLLNLQTPLHFKNGTRVSISGPQFSSFNSMEKHHIFPVALLERLGFSKNMVHRLPNFCFLPMELNRWIGDKAPSKYMLQIYNEFGEEHFERVMASHLIPVDEHSGIWSDNYDRFLRQRAELLFKEVVAQN